MNKRSRVSLLVLAVALLALVVAVPAFSKGGADTCAINFPHTHPNFDMARNILIEGELDAYYIDDGIVNECKGFVPLGEEINPQMSWFTFDELCLAYKVQCNNKEFYFEDNDPDLGLEVRDPDSNRVYLTGEYTFSVKEMNGLFIFTKIYRFDEE